MDTVSVAPSVVRARTRLASRLPSLALVLFIALAGSAWAQERPTWVVEPGSGALVEPFAFPSSIQRADAALVVTCDTAAPEGLNVGVIFGSYGVPVPPEVDVLVRRDREAPRRAPWLTDEASSGLPRYFEEVSAILADLRAGGTFAVRVFLFQGVDDAAQPTFQFDVGGFAAVERDVDCATAGNATDDPFADVGATPSTLAPSAPAAPSTPGRRGAGSTPSAAATTGEWSIDPSSELFSYSDGQGRLFGFICGASDDGTPVIFLDLPGVPVASSDGIARFDFARAGGSGDTASWNFVDVGDGLYVTDTVATDDIAFKLLPDDGPEPWNTLVVGVTGGAGAVLVVPGEDLVAQFYTSLTCVR